MKLKSNIAIAALSSVLITTQTLAGITGPPPTVAQAPALDEWGLIGLVALLGGAGLFALFKRK